jgi:SAM-dependent methyltransferase
MDIFSIEHVKELLKKVGSNSEFEIIFNKNTNMTINKFIDVLKYLTVLSNTNKYKLIKETTLDVGMTSITNKDIINYRITISNIDNINSIINNVKLRKNHVIFSLLVNNIINNYKDITIMKKTKLEKDMVDINEYDMRIRLSDESDVSKQELETLLTIDENERHNIFFRFKQRISVVLSSDEKHELKIDLTQIKQSGNLNDIMKSLDRYELEMDLSTFGKVDLKKVVETMNTYVEKIYKNIIGSNVLIKSDEQKEIINKYKELVFNDKENTSRDLAGMQVASLEIQHLVDILPNKYSVTDKADGVRYFLFIVDEIVYLISNNLAVIKTDHKVAAKYNNTLIDGELLYIGKYKKYVFLGFDILFDKGVDVRDKIKLSERYSLLSENVQTIFGSKLENKPYTGDFDVAKVSEFYAKQVKVYMDDLNKSLKSDKSIFIIKYKFFAFPLGGNGCEIFNYSNRLWELITKELDCPYTLDGMIMTPLEQKYTKNVREQKFKNLKWKPKEMNSIDFYLEYEKNAQNEILDVFDDIGTKGEKEETLDTVEKELTTTKNNKIAGKVYRIANLFVGKIKNGVEYPVLFHKDKMGYLAHIYITDKEPRDIEGNIIQDKTVVEFAYNNDPLVNEADRWIPLRTRFDKTEMVNKYKKKYGNNDEIAEKVWRSILMPIDISDLQILGNPKTYENHLVTMRGKIDVRLIETSRSEDVYYQLKTDLASPQRDFHNWIKSVLIYNYCSKDINNEKQIVLDIGIGRGGDIMKYYSAKVGELVGIDPDNNGINSATDGAYSRYNNMKRKFPGFTKMTFMVADAGIKLNLNDQSKVANAMDDKNKQYINTIFGETEKDKSMKFDIISSQFALHYLFKDENTFNNLCENVNKLLKPNGYFVITTMDGDLVHKELEKKNGLIESYYTNKEGTKKKFFHVQARYDLKSNINKTGIAIDFYNSCFQEEGNSMVEYLITKKFITEEFKKKCNLELVESENFENIYNTFKPFLMGTSKFEENLNTREYFGKVAKFYNLNDEVNKASFELSRLNKLYVFQKRN